MKHLLCPGHEVIIEKPLAFGEAAHDNMLILLGHLLLHIILETAQEERPQHLHVV